MRLQRYLTAVGLSHTACHLISLYPVITEDVILTWQVGCSSFKKFNRSWHQQTISICWQRHCEPVSQTKIWFLMSLTLKYSVELTANIYHPTVATLNWFPLLLLSMQQIGLLTTAQPRHHMITSPRLAGGFLRSFGLGKPSEDEEEEEVEVLWLGWKRCQLERLKPVINILFNI